MNNKILKIFLVDDEPGFRSGIEDILEEYSVNMPHSKDIVSFETKSYSDGESFIEALKSDTPNIVVLDCKLPGISGLEILEEYLLNQKNIFTLFITAYANLETAIKATKLGAFDFLAKPFTPDEFRYSLRKIAIHAILTEQARKYEEERKQIRFQFISILAHELKSPINAIDGYLDIIKSRVAGEDWDTYDKMLDRSQVRIDGMRKLISDLLDLTSIESGKRKRNIKEINVSERIKFAIDGIKYDADLLNIKINYKSSKEIFFFLDQSEIDMILNNLISNAVKYNVRNGKVDVSAELNNRELKITFTDTGIGISEDNQKRLFQEFVRIKDKKTENINGSGLGLSVLKKIVDLYDGNIVLHSKKNEGSTFIITLKQST